MAIKKIKINKVVKEIDYFLDISIKREKALEILNQKCNYFGGYDNVFRNPNTRASIQFSVIIRSMIEYGELMSRAKN